MSTSQELISRARSLMASMRIGEADGVWRELVERHPDDANLRTMFGVSRKMMGDTDAALGHLRAATELDEHHADSRFHLGKTLQQLGRLTEADKALRQALSVDPNHVPARVTLAQVQEQSGRVDDALTSLRMALRADADNVPALSEMARLLLARGELEQADRHASRAVQLSPEDPRAQLAMSGIFQARGQWDFAEQTLHNAIERTPDRPPLWSALGAFYQAAGRDGQAVAAFERAEQLRQGAGLEPAAILAMARSLQAVGRTHEARQRLERLHEAVSLQGDSLLLLAQLRLEDGDAAAAGQLREPLGQSLGSGQRLLDAWLAEAEDRHDRAADLAAALHEVDHAQVSRQARLLSGRLAVRRGDHAAAERALGELAVKDHLAAWMLAEGLRRGGAGERAREVLESLLEDHDRLDATPRAMTHARLAWLLDELDRPDRAAMHLERCAWQGMPQAAERINATPAEFSQDLMALDRQPWPSAATETDVEPVFVLGWPGSGRENMIRALIEAGIPRLDPAEAGRRRRALGLPLAVDDLLAHDAARLRMARRRYFRGCRIAAGRVLEPVWLEATDLPALARFFPNAQVILPAAEVGDLELHWWLSGHSGIEQMLALWQRDQALIDHLKDRLDLRFVDVPRQALIDDPAQAAATLAGIFDHEDVAGLTASIGAALARYPLKSDGRWREYRDLLVSVR